jgi:predicted Rossmann fold flavoprotein
MENIVSNKKFLISALKTFDVAHCMDFFEKLGLPLKTERGNRVFPESDKSSDVISVLRKELTRLGVTVKLNEKVLSISVENGNINEIITDKNVYKPDRVIIATGGISYPLTGSTGDGYIFSKKLGHTVIPPAAGLNGIKIKNAVGKNGESVSLSDYPKLAGLTLKNVSAKISDAASGKILFEEFGEMRFTDKGADGPIILTLSSKINRMNFDKLFLKIDLKPALDTKKLDGRILRDFTAGLNKPFGRSLDALLPSEIIPLTVKISGIPPEKPVNSIDREQRGTLADTIKSLMFRIGGIEDIPSAIITAGGVSVKEINPKTMQSKLIGNLYFAGEIIDVDALTGGYNLQIAFSTGYVAGTHAALTGGGEAI